MPRSTFSPKAWLLGLLFLSRATAFAGELPPIRAPEEAVAQLSLEGEARQLQALENVREACRGRLRHALKDHGPVIARVELLAKTGSPKLKKKVLDLARCFSVGGFLRILRPILGSQEAPVLSYALEVAGQVSAPEVSELLLQELESKGARCLEDGLAAEAVELCVWLYYAPGASPPEARPLRERMARLASPGLKAPYPKVREVAVETVAAARIKSYHRALAELIEKEKKKHFSPANDPALVKRFEERLRKLKAKGE